MTWRSIIQISPVSQVTWHLLLLWGHIRFNLLNFSEYHKYRKKITFNKNRENWSLFLKGIINACNKLTQCKAFTSFTIQCLQLFNFLRDCESLFFELGCGVVPFTEGIFLQKQISISQVVGKVGRNLMKNKYFWTLIAIEKKCVHTSVSHVNVASECTLGWH